jgi:geranylgeranyl pyrophosphate synthase
MKDKKLIMNINKLLIEKSKIALKRAKKEIRQEKRESKEINKAFNYYAKAWNDVVHPGLISIGYEAADGKDEDIETVQVATLILTAGFDIHDDIIDESKTKHGKPTVYGKFGKNIALLVGDAFLMKALVLLHKLDKQLSTKKTDEIWSIIDSLFFELGDAEALEASLMGKVNVSVEECFRLLEMKSATFEAHMRIGAILGGGEPHVVDLLGKFGRNLGILINVREDFIDVFEAEELQNRYVNEVLPIPILYAFKNKQTKKTIMDILSKQRITDKNAEQIVDIIYENEDVQEFKKDIIKMLDRTYRDIEALQNNAFSTLADFLIKGLREDL